MNNDPSVPPPTPFSQPENNGGPAAGNEWNNGISRRSFLKRTGGATVGTVIAWNLTSSIASAEAPKKKSVYLKATLTLATAGKVCISGGPTSSAVFSEEVTLNSGQTVGGWWKTGGSLTSHVDWNDGQAYIDGPGTYVWGRAVQGW